MHYADNKMKDLYTRMGNSILKELREFDKQQKNLIIEEAVGKRKMSDRSMGSRTGWLWSRTLRSLKKSMDKDWQQIQNEREYEALQERSMDEVER